MAIKDRIYQQLKKKSDTEQKKVLQLQLQKAELEREIAIAKGKKTQ